MTVLALLAALLTAPPSADDLAVQGLLRTNSGTVDGSYALTMSVYDQDAGGAAFFSQTLPAVAVTNGVFSASLAGLGPDLVATHPVLWVGVKVEGELELPRQRMLPVARALVASRALSLGCTGCVTSSMLATGAAPTYSAGFGLLLDQGTFAVDLAALDGRYVNAAGDTMTGPLTVQSDVTVTGTLTAGRLSLPRITTATLPVPSASNAGDLYFATDTGRLVYSDGARWVAVGEQPPAIVSIAPNQVAPGVAATITITGSSFMSGAKVEFGDTKSSSVTLVSGTQLQVAVPLGLTAGSYDVVVTNPSGLQGTLTKGLVVDAPPGWQTPAGSLGQLLDVGASALTVQALDPEGQLVTYAVVAGSLPPGLTLEPSTGKIVGDPVNVAASTVSTFTVAATDSAPTPNSVTRGFQITVTPAPDGTTALRAGASCQAILAAGLATGSKAYWIAPAGIGAFEVYCDNVTEGGGWIDVVRTMNLPGIDFAVYRDRFFMTNNGFALQVGAGAETSTGAPGFYVINLATTYAHTEGCHFKPPLAYTKVRLSYRMQGNDEGFRCSSTSWIPLNGPGYDGGFDGYLSSCPGAYTCIQGRPTDLRDAPISATYTSDSITASTLLTFSGSGVGTGITGSCARDAAIPITNPCTFFTRLLIK